MLSQQLESTVELVKKYGKVDQLYQKIEKRDAYMQKLWNLSDELDRIVSWLLDASERSLNFSDQTILAVKKAIDEMRSVHQISGSPSVDFDINTLSRFRSELNAVKKQIIQEWKDLYARKTSTSFELLSVLQKVYPTEYTDFHKKLDKFKDWRIELNLKLFMNWCEEAERFVLSKNSAKTEVRKFLEKISNETATLDDLTQPVRDWIEENNLSRRIKLSF